MNKAQYRISDQQLLIMNMLRSRLQQHGYNGEKLAGLHVNTLNMPSLEHRFSDEQPLSILIRLFLIGLDLDSIGTVFSSQDLVSLKSAGIIAELENGQMRSEFKIHPYKHLNLLCDFAQGRKMQQPVYTPGEDSTSLADAGIRRPFASALDLCTGSGIQAIMAASHTQDVTAIDLSPRAAYLARLNCWLNDVGSVTIKEGNLYQPVSGQTFDFITANPPFVTAEVDSLAYRDGGTRGDDILIQIMDGLPSHLNDGGYSQIVTHLYEFEDLSHLTMVQKFAERHDFEALVFLSKGFDKYELATSQYRSFIRDYSVYREKVMSYIDHLDRVKYQYGYLGVITFRRSGHHRFQKMNTLNQPVVFPVNHADNLNRFFQSTDGE